MKYRLGGVLAIATLLLVLIGRVSLRSPDGLDERFARLTRGINAAHWFAQAPLTAETFTTHITERDLRLMHDLGFRHVRLPLDPTVLFQPDQPTQLNVEALVYFDTALDQILNQDLAVIVDLHPPSDFKRQLYDDPAFVDAVGQFWYALAHHLRDRPPERVFLEVMNEPATRDPQQWYTIQTQLLRQMRRGAPAHTLIASANIRVEDTWDDIEGLEAMTPVEDTNVVYNFHFYKPMSFTHQGADWGEEAWGHLRQVPYPGSPEAIAPVLPTIADDTARSWLERYGEEQWNADKIAERIQRAANWGRSHQVHVTCNEFGVYRKVVQLGDRSAWIRDVRTSLERHHLGWAMWEYNAGFGIFPDADAQEPPSPEIINALLGE